MPRIIKNIPLMDLMSFVMETPDSPIAVGAVQILQPVNGSREDIVERLLAGFRDSPVDEPFNYVPVFPTFGMPKWAECEKFDADYHVRHVAVPAPGTEKQLLDLVMDLHAGLLDRSRPGWIAYVIDGLENGRVATYWKVQHAYIDGAAATARIDAAASRSPDDLAVRPIWSPLFKSRRRRQSAPQGAMFEQLGRQFGTHARALGEVGAAMGRSLLQAGGYLRREMPVPFSAPNSLFNGRVHATRRLGVGSTPLARLQRIARQEGVKINEVALTLVGAALERYTHDRGEAMERPLVAACPMALRTEVNSGAATQIAAISVRLGDPGSEIRSRLDQVHVSSRDAKADAARMSREALMDYLVLVGGVSDAISKSPLGEYMPPLTNVNVSNVAGPSDRCYIGGAEVVRGYPVSTLAGGTAINITFNSFAGHMDFAAITDAIAIPDPQKIADYILAALDELEIQVGLSASRKPKAKARSRAGSKAKAKAKAKRTKAKSPRASDRSRRSRA